MKKIIGILLAGALVTSAFAVDFNAKVKMSGDILGGTIDLNGDEVDDNSINALKINNGIVDNGFREYDSNGDNVVSRLIKLLTYKYSQSSNGKITYQEEFNWRTFHSLINFINSYDRDLKIQNTVEDSKHMVKAKKREIPKQEDIEDFEQLSFKDLI